MGLACRTLFSPAVRPPVAPAWIVPSGGAPFRMLAGANCGQDWQGQGRLVFCRPNARLDEAAVDLRHE